PCARRASRARRWSRGGRARGARSSGRTRRTGARAGPPPAPRPQRRARTRARSPRGTIGRKWASQSLIACAMQGGTARPARPWGFDERRPPAAPPATGGAFSWAPLEAVEARVGAVTELQVRVGPGGIGRRELAHERLCGGAGERRPIALARLAVA